MAPNLPAPVLNIAPDALKDLDSSDHLSGLWFAFTKCKTSLNEGQRLENISWRLWYREMASTSSYRPLTPDTPSEMATKATDMPFATRRIRTVTSIPSRSSPAASPSHQPIGRVIFEMLLGSSPETARVLNSKLKLPDGVLATSEAERFSIAIIPPKREPPAVPSVPSSASSLSISHSPTRPLPARSNSHRSSSLSSTSNSNHSSSGTGPVVVVVNPTPNPTPHPTPPATPVLLPATLPASNGSQPHATADSLAPGRHAQVPQPTVSRLSGKHLLPPVQVSLQSSNRLPIPSALLPPSPSSNSNDSGSSISGSPFTAMTDTSATSASSSPSHDSTLRPTDAKKFVVGMSHDRDQSSQSSESPTSSHEGYTSTPGYPYQQGINPLQAMTNVNNKATFALNSGAHHPHLYSDQSQHVQAQSQSPSPSQALSHLYPQSSHPQLQQLHTRSQSQGGLQQQSYAHAHVSPYPSNHSPSKIRLGESSGSRNGAASNDAFKAGGSGNGGKIGHTGSSITTTIGTTSSATSGSSTNSASGSDLRSRNRNQRVPSIPNGTAAIAHANNNMKVQHQQRKSDENGNGISGGGGHSGRKASESSEINDEWSESEEEEERDKGERNGSGNALSHSMDSTGASVSGTSAGSGSRSRSRGRADRHNGLMMMSASAKGKRKVGLGETGGHSHHTVGRKGGRQALGHHGLAKHAHTQAQGLVAMGQSDVKVDSDLQGRTQAKGKGKERLESTTGSVPSVSGSGGSGHDSRETEMTTKKERELTVTKKAFQQMKGLYAQGSGLGSAAEDVSSKTSGSSSTSSQQPPHGLEPATTSAMLSKLEPAPYYHQVSATTTVAAPSGCGATRQKAMFNIGSHSSDGDQSKSGLSVAGSSCTGLVGSDVGSNSNEGSMSPPEVTSGDGVYPQQQTQLPRAAAYANLRLEPMTSVMPPSASASDMTSTKSSSRTQSRRSSGASAGSRNVVGPSADSSKQTQQQQPVSTQSSQQRSLATTSAVAQNQVQAQPATQQHQQASSRADPPAAMAGGLPQPMTNEGIAEATALIEQNQQRQKNRKVVIDTDEDEDTMDDGEGEHVIEGDDDDSEYVTEESDDEEGDWTSDDASGEETGGNKGKARDGKATTAAAGQEKTSDAQKGHGPSSATQKQQQQQQQQPPVHPAVAQLQRPPMHGRHLSQPNVPTVAGMAKAKQQAQLQMEYDVQQKEIQLQQQQLALQKEREQQAQVRASNMHRTNSRRQRDREKERDLREAEIRLRELEAQRKRDMFAKVPQRNYSNLQRSKSGLLSQLMNPDPNLFPPSHPYRKGFSSGDVASGGGAPRGVARVGIAPITALSNQGPQGQHQQQQTIGGISAMAPPKDGHGPGHSGQTQGQGQGQGHGRGQTKPPTAAAMSPPAMMTALKPNKSAVALPVANQLTAVSVKDGTMVKGKEKEKEKDVVSSSTKYRPRGRPEDQEMETESEDEGQNALQGSLTAQEKLEKLLLFKSNSAGSSKQPQGKQQQPLAPEQQRRPPALRQAHTDEPLRHHHQPNSPSAVPIQRSQSQIIPGVPLGYPYNLPPAPVPSSPRTTRQRMLREEMSESVRQNLLWHRQLSKAVVVGPRRRSSENSGLQPLTAITTVPPLVHLTKKKTPPDTPTDQESSGNGDSVEGIAMTFHERKVPMTRTRSWAGGGR